ncbi:PKD domain-containing protein [Natrinema caseinilyticum]|uniref:PKD domain-containing protein n=1 Tax=Natrinema caseinilyticum TaxID=2961570 RepID=UPI0020C54418|nr:PKD domain-containing protein [Natrinema caseinilyticum]
MSNQSSTGRDGVSNGTDGVANETEDSSGRETTDKRPTRHPARGPTGDEITRENGDARQRPADSDPPEHATTATAERSGMARRIFLRSAAVAGAAATFGSTAAAAREESCESFATMPIGGGDFQLVNNDWGSSAVDMCIWSEANGDYGYEWSTRSSGGPPNYPQGLLGTKPWGSDTGVRDFPIRRGDVDQLELEVDIDQTISGGEWDLAEEWWLMDSPVSEQTQTHTHEIMVVLDWGGGHNHYMEEENVWTDTFGNTIDYWANYSSGGTSADFHIFRVRGGLSTGRVDLTEVIDFMTERYGVSDRKWISGIELGNEYWQGSQGDVTFNQFDVTINGTTYSSGGGSTGGGGDDGSGGDSGDEDGGSSDPIATLSPSTTSAGVDELITFHVQDTSGTGRWITDLAWDFGDGTTATGWWNAHRYDSPGTYTVALTATANTGNRTTHEVTVTVS